LITVDSFTQERDEYLTWRRYVEQPIDLHHITGMAHRDMVRPKGVGVVAPVADECLLRLTAPADQPARRR